MSQKVKNVISKVLVQILCLQAMHDYVHWHLSIVDKSLWC